MSYTPPVLLVGDVSMPPAESAGLAIHRAESAAAVDEAVSPACLVVNHDAGTEAVATLHERYGDCPLLYVDAEPDGLTATEVTRAGATGYVVPGAPGEETLGDRIRAVVADRATADEATRGPRRDREALRRFHEIASDTDDEFETKVEHLLEVGCAYLDVDVGFLTDVGTDDLTITHATDPDGTVTAGQTLPMEETYCKRTVDSDGTFAVHDAVAEGWVGDPAYEQSGLRCYLGGRVAVDGTLRGTLCFADTEPRPEPFRESEERFVELLVRWLESELERRARERELREARDRTRQTLERIDDAFFSLDDEWRVVYLNDEAKRALADAFADGIDADDVVGTNVWEAAPAAVDTPFFDAFHEAMETQESVAFEEYYAPLGVWFSVRAYPSPSGLSVYFRDVTDRHRRERALDGLLEASRSLMTTSRPAEIADIVGTAAADILGYPANTVRLYDGEADLLRPTVVTERTREIMGVREAYPPGAGFSGTAFATGEPQYVPDGSQLGKGPAYADVGALYAYPLGEYGVLTIGTTEEGAIDETDRTLVELLAATAEAAFDAAEREAALRRYRAVYEHTSEMVLVTDGEGTVTLATQPLADRLDETTDWLVDSDLRQLFHPEGAERARTVAQALRESGDRSRVFETNLRGDDGVVPVEVEVSLLPTDGDRPASSVLVVRDITELERTRSELADERVRFEQLFERSPDAIVDVEYTDDTPVVRAVNGAFEETFGYDADRVVGHDLNTFIALDDGEQPPLSDERTSIRDHVATEVRRSTASGERDFIFRGVPYDGDGRIPRAFGIYTDVTDRKRRERRLLVFDRMLRHNLRNEATTILGFTDELRRELDGDRAHWAERANAAARRLAESSERVRWVQRALDSDAPATPASLESVVTDVLEDARTEHPESTLTGDVPADHEVSNGHLLRVALQELVENAIQYTDQEAPTVEVTVDEGPRGRHGMLPVRVLDDGPGIPERERAVLTDEREITQLDHSRGLGLWIARWATQALGGRLRFEDRDVGAAVVLEVPVTGDGTLEVGETERRNTGD